MVSRPDQLDFSLRARPSRQPPPVEPNTARLGIRTALDSGGTAVGGDYWGRASGLGAMRSRTRCRRSLCARRRDAQTTSRRGAPYRPRTQAGRVHAREEGQKTVSHRGIFAVGRWHADRLLLVVSRPFPTVSPTSSQLVPLPVRPNPTLYDSDDPSTPQLSPSRRARRTRPTSRRRPRSAGSSCRPRSPRSCARSTACVPRLDRLSVAVRGESARTLTWMWPRCSQTRSIPIRKDDEVKVRLPLHTRACNPKH